MFKKIFVAFFITFQLLSVSSVFSAPLADSADIFSVSSPSANSVLEGVRDVSFIMYDDDAVSIPFTADLLEYPSCTQSFGSITSQTSGISHSSTPTTINWNTNSTQSTASLNDGHYCLRICAQLLNGETPYSVCNSRVVVLVNNNELPSITNSPSDFSIYEGQAWSYDIQAFDADGDVLSYSLISAPNFLSLNSNKLTISAAPLLADDVASLTYNVTFAVNDNLSGSVTSSFNITLINPDVTINEENTSTDNNFNQTGAKINIIKPQADQVIFENIFRVEWNITNTSDKVSSFELEYSKDGLEWITAQGESLQSNRFDWNTKSVLDGAYYIRLKVVFEDGSSVLQRSPRFVIDKTANVDFSSIPLIVNVRPQNNETQVSITSISGELVASKDATINPDSLELVVDEVNLSDKCSVTLESFECLFEESFSSGVHEASVSIQDSSGSSNEFIWQFSVGNPANPVNNQNSQSSFNLFGRVIARSSFYLLVVLCILVFIVLFIPWLLYALWRRDDEGNTTDSFETTIYPVNDVYPQTTVTTNYYQPDSYPTTGNNTTYFEPPRVS